MTLCVTLTQVTGYKTHNVMRNVVKPNPDDDPVRDAELSHWYQVA